MVQKQLHRWSLTFIRLSPQRRKNTSTITPLKRTRFTNMMTNIHVLLLGLILLSCGNHPHTKTTTYVMAFSTHRGTSPHVSMATAFLHPTPHLLLRQNGRETALHQESQERRGQKPSTATMTHTNQRFKYKYFVDTLLLFRHEPVHTLRHHPQKNRN
jgi:hypothetical protein